MTRRHLLALIPLTLLTACGSSAEPGARADATPTMTPRPTFTATLVPTATLTPAPTPTPAPTATVTVEPSPTAVPEATATLYYVSSGDTLSGIASSFGISVDALMKANGLTGSIISVGQELIIPAETESTD